MKTNKERIEKIRSLLLKEVSLYIQFKMGITDFQITRVLLSSDLKHAKFLFVNIYDRDEEVPKWESFLNKNSKKIRNDLFRKLGLKYVPDFIFEYDQGGKEI